MTISVILLGVLVLIFAYSAKWSYSTYQQRKIAKWARGKKGQARALLVMFNLAMATCGAFLGLFLNRIGVEMSESLLYVGLGLFIVGTLIYPKRDRQAADVAIRYRKKQYATLLRTVGSTVALIAYANEFVGAADETLISESAVHPAVWIVLSTLGLLICGFFILALSCSLACQGYEGLAIGVAVVGLGGFIFLYVWGMIRIGKAWKKRLKEEEQPDDRSGLLDDDLIE